MAARTKTFTSIRDEEHVISEAQGRRSREQILLDAPAERILAGTVLGKITRGAAAAIVAAPAAGNTGTGTFAALPTADANVDPGVYRVIIDEEAANAGDFRVERPDGTLDGRGTVGVAYNGRVNFTLNDGGVDFDVDDSFTITVGYAEGNGRYKPLDPAATDGSQVAAALLAPTEDPTDPVGHVRTSAHVRDCEVNGHKIFWPDGITSDQQATAEAQLAEQGVLVRY